MISSICTVLCERALFEEVGVFDADLSQCADWDMWIRLATRTDFLYVDQPLVTYRQHDTNMSRNARLLEKDSQRVLANAFALPNLRASIRSRRRQAQGRNFMVLAGTYLQAGQWRSAIRCGVKAVLNAPSTIGYAARLPLRRVRRRSAGVAEF